MAQATGLPSWSLLLADPSEVWSVLLPSLSDLIARLLSFAKSIPPNLPKAPSEERLRLLENSRIWVHEVASLLGVTVADWAEFLYPREAVLEHVAQGRLHPDALDETLGLDFRCLYPTPRWVARQQAAEAQARLERHAEALQAAPPPTALRGRFQVRSNILCGLEANRRMKRTRQDRILRYAWVASTTPSAPAAGSARCRSLGRCSGVRCGSTAAGRCCGASR
jgi:hypothetical protein